MWFDGYHRQFGKRLEEFHAVAIPAMLSELSPVQVEQVTQGSKEFPFDAVLDVLNSKHSYEDKVSRILAISGTTTNKAVGDAPTL